VLIVAYRRAKNVSQILDICNSAQVDQIYITVDAPRDHSPDAETDHATLLEEISNFERKTGREVQKRISSVNQGCAANVLQGCDWAFKNVQNLIVIEDDCIPTNTFVDFCKKQIKNLDLNPLLWLICGTQFAPIDITDKQPFLSKYALTWGWATTRNKWQEMRKVFHNPVSNFYFLDIFRFTKPENSFWSAGSRRARLGFTDVWDTVLLDAMRTQHKYAILPPVNLVLNLGSDNVSTHVHGDSKWTNRAVNNDYVPESKMPIINDDADKWLKQYFYEISLRHAFTTKITFLFDLLQPRKRRKFLKPLAERLAS
jgi:hypothetical protein